MRLKLELPLSPVLKIKNLIYKLIYGDVKVSTGIVSLGKRVAERNRFKSRSLKINDKTELAYAA